MQDWIPALWLLGLAVFIFLISHAWKLLNGIRKTVESLSTASGKAEHQAAINEDQYWERLEKHEASIRSRIETVQKKIEKCKSLLEAKKIEDASETWLALGSEDIINIYGDAVPSNPSLNSALINMSGALKENEEKISFFIGSYLLLLEIHLELQELTLELALTDARAVMHINNQSLGDKIQKIQLSSKLDKLSSYIRKRSDELDLGVQQEIYGKRT